MKEIFSGFVFGEQFVLIASGQFKYSVLGLRDRRILLSQVMTAMRLMANEHREESGKTDGFVVPDSLQIAPECLGTDINTEHRLSVWSGFCSALLRRIIDAGRDLAEQIFLITGLKRFQPNGPMFRFRQCIDPFQKSLQAFDRRVFQLRGIDLQKMGQLM